MASSRSAIGSRASDPLEPLRAMADRVGKEVERFAEEVDNWQAHGKEDSVVYKSTVKLVDNFRGLAESRVRDLKKKSSTDDQDELDKNVRRRIKGLANDDGQRLFAESARSIVPSIEPSAASGVRELRHWQAELATWELLRVVIEQHHPAPGVDVAARKSARLANAGGKSRYSPKNEVWDRFILEDDAAREKMIIIKWLQSTARNTENDIKSLLGQWGEVSGKDTNTWTSGWLDTKAAIKQAKRVQGVDKPLDKDHTIHGKGTVDPLVTRLDPDAPCRQVRALHKTDDIYENALWMVCYEMLRQGEPWEKISEWCKDRNEAWRSVSLGAAFATHPDGGPNLAGNDLGYLFRRMCVYASRGAKMPYEGAVYALLSGETKRIVESEVIKSWDEHLYGYYNGLLLSRFDSYIRQNPQSQPWVSDEAVLDFVFHDASRFDVDDWETSSQQIIEKLMKDGAVTSTEAKTPIKLIQGALISQKTEDLLYKVGVALADILQDDDRPLNLIIDPDTEDLHNPTSKKAIGDRSVVADPHHQALARDPHALRLLAHICMIYREGIQTIKWEEDAEAYAMQNVVVAYIEVLRLKKKYQTIPIYANHLGIWRATHCLSRILPDIKNSEEQKIFADLMSSEAYGFDPVLVIRENFMFHLMALGYLERNPVSVPEPVSKFTIVGKWTEGKDAYLWPGLRIQNDIDGFDITSKEEDLLQSLQWFRHVVADCEQTFQCLEMALTVLLRKCLALLVKHN
jgi:nuclear pore complex protein Nup107